MDYPVQLPDQLVFEIRVSALFFPAIRLIFQSFPFRFHFMRRKVMDRQRSLVEAGMVKSEGSAKSEIKFLAGNIFKFKTIIFLAGNI